MSIQNVLPNGTLAPVDDIPAALLYGYCVYTSFRLPVSKNTLQQHLRRLTQDGYAFGMSFPWTQACLEKVLADLPDCAVRLTLLPQADNFHDITHQKTLTPRLLLSTRPLPKELPPEKIFIVENTRVLPLIKHGSMAEDLFLKRLAISQGYDDILRINAQGHITESSTANFFCVDLNNKTLYTPQPDRDGCLPGIEREEVLTRARNDGWTIAEPPISISALKAMDAAFLTNAVMGFRSIESLTYKEQTFSFRPLTEMILFFAGVNANR